MKKGQYLNALLRAENTVFSVKDIALLWREVSSITVRSRLHYYLKTNQLIHLRRGLYAKDKNYDRFELATRILKPSYISFETVLAKAGIIFQYYGNINLASYTSREVICDNTTFSFRRIKAEILTNPLGIDQTNQYSIASPERAMLDMLYLTKEYYFDNLFNIDWDSANTILKIYNNNKMNNVLNTLYKKFKAESK